MAAVDKMFERIDKALDSKGGNELYILYFGIFVIVAAVVYLYIYPLTVSSLNQTQKSINDLEKKILMEEGYLRSKTVNNDQNYYIKLEMKKIREIKNRLNDVIYKNGYIDNKLKKLSYLLYNDVNWANFIDDIAKKAKKYHIDINMIKNSFNKINYKKVEQVMDIEVDANGNFNNIMKFINSIEESKLVVDIHDLIIEVDKNLHIDFKIAVWGIKY